MRSLHKILILCFLSFTSSFAQEANIYLDLGIKKFVGKESLLKREKFFGVQANNASETFISSNAIFTTRPEIKASGISFKGVSSLANNALTEMLKNDISVIKIQGLDVTSNTNTSILSENIIKAFSKVPVSKKVILSFDDSNNTNNWVKSTSKTALLYKNLGSKLEESSTAASVSSPSLPIDNIENNDFDIFKSTIKTFVDISGKEIDQYTLDISDGVDVATQSIAYRSGAILEATFDLLNTYHFVKHNKTKPFYIASYGLKFDNWLNEAHSNYNDALIIESLNNQVMALLDKPDNISLAVPTIFANAEATPKPYSLISLNSDNNYGTTDLIKFYDFWKDVAGERTYISSDHTDIQVNAFKNGNKWINIFNNLSDKTQTLNLKFSEYDAERIKKYHLRRIYTNASGVAEITEAHTDLHIDQLDIEPFETFMLILDIPDDTEFATSIVEYNNYSKSYLKPIVANEPTIFDINNTVVGKGRANIRLSFAREKKLSRYPIVKLNDNVVLTPENWAGYDQANRNQFFGTLVIPVPLSYVKPSNKISVTFPDSGGQVSSVVINTEIFSNDVQNENYVEKNASVFVSHGGILLNVSKKLQCVSPRILDKNGNVIKKIKGYHAGNTVDISTLKTGEYIFKLKNGAEYPFKK